MSALTLVIIGHFLVRSLASTPLSPTARFVSSECACKRVGFFSFTHCFSNTEAPSSGSVAQAEISGGGGGSQVEMCSEAAGAAACYPPSADAAVVRGGTLGTSLGRLEWKCDRGRWRKRHGGPNRQCLGSMSSWFI